MLAQAAIDRALAAVEETHGLTLREGAVRGAVRRVEMKRLPNGTFAPKGQGEVLRPGDTIHTDDDGEMTVKATGLKTSTGAKMKKHEIEIDSGGSSKVIGLKPHEVWLGGGISSLAADDEDRLRARYEQLDDAKLRELGRTHEAPTYRKVARWVLKQRRGLQEANAGWEKLIAALVATGLSPKQAEAVLAKNFAAKKGPQTKAGRGEARKVVGAKLKRLPNGTFAPAGQGQVLQPGQKVEIPGTKKQDVGLGTKSGNFTVAAVGNQTVDGEPMGDDEIQVADDGGAFHKVALKPGSAELKDKPVKPPAKAKERASMAPAAAIPPNATPVTRAEDIKVGDIFVGNEGVPMEVIKAGPKTIKVRAYPENRGQTLPREAIAGGAFNWKAYRGEVETLKSPGTGGDADAAKAAFEKAKAAGADKADLAKLAKAARKAKTGGKKMPADVASVEKSATAEVADDLEPGTGAKNPLNTLGFGDKKDFPGGITVTVGADSSGESTYNVIKKGKGGKATKTFSSPKQAMEGVKALQSGKHGADVDVEKTAAAQKAKKPAKKSAKKSGEIKMTSDEAAEHNSKISAKQGQTGEAAGPDFKYQDKVTVKLPNSKMTGKGGFTAPGEVLGYEPDLKTYHVRTTVPDTGQTIVGLYPSKVLSPTEYEMPDGTKKPAAKAPGKSQKKPSAAAFTGDPKTHFDMIEKPESGYPGLNAALSSTALDPKLQELGFYDPDAEYDPKKATAKFGQKVPDSAGRLGIIIDYKPNKAGDREKDRVKVEFEDGTTTTVGYKKLGDVLGGHKTWPAKKFDDSTIEDALEKSLAATGDKPGKKAADAKLKKGEVPSSEDLDAIAADNKKKAAAIKGKGANVLTDLSDTEGMTEGDTFGWEGEKYEVIKAATEDDSTITVKGYTSNNNFDVVDGELQQWEGGWEDGWDEDLSFADKEAAVKAELEKQGIDTEAREAEIEGAVDASQDLDSAVEQAKAAIDSDVSGVGLDDEGEGEGLAEFIIATPNGERMWQADDEAHAVEQHKDAFPEEEVLTVNGQPPPPEVASDPAQTALKAYQDAGGDDPAILAALQAKADGEAGDPDAGEGEIDPNDDFAAKVAQQDADEAGGLQTNTTDTRIGDLVQGQELQMADGTQWVYHKAVNPPFHIMKPKGGGKAKPIHKDYAPPLVAPAPGGEETGAVLPDAPTPTSDTDLFDTLKKSVEDVKAENEAKGIKTTSAKPPTMADKAEIAAVQGEDIANSPGRGKNGNIRNFKAMKKPGKLEGTIAELEAYGKDPDALEAAKLALQLRDA